jgi:hypothetical protein
MATTGPASFFPATRAKTFNGGKNEHKVNTRREYHLNAFLFSRRTAESCFAG